MWPCLFGPAGSASEPTITPASFTPCAEASNTGGAGSNVKTPPWYEKLKGTSSRLA
jgi:hypothetical protein